MSEKSATPLYVRTREPMSRHESGLIGATARWGATRRLNLGDLTDEQRRVVLALVEAQRAANAALNPPEAESPGERSST